MTAQEQPAKVSAAEVYRGFLDAVNRQDLVAAETFIDVARYRENCVGFTRGFVAWDEAKESVQTVWKGIPDLHVDLHEVMADEDVALARGTVSGTASGRLYGAPATKRGYQASFFDYVRLSDGLIVERIQQADILGQMRQLYGKGLGVVGLAAMFLRQ
jgi:predicted ester cyclase